MSPITPELPHLGAKELLERVSTLNLPFACIYRPLSDSKQQVLVLEGEIAHIESIDELSMEEVGLSKERKNDISISQLVLLPFNQLKQKEYACIDDAEEVIVMHVNRQTYYPINQLVAAIDDSDLEALNIHFDICDKEYVKIAGAVIDEDISTGEGSNFVISRSLEGDIVNFSINHALTLFKRVLKAECGSYWTWMIYTGERYFIGSTPEQHLQVSDRHVTMNPISGTLRYPDSGKFEETLNDFLQDKKEHNELFMVVDEELKMMSSICNKRIKVSGPKLKMMSHVAHTEYFIAGESQLALSEILKRSLFAPTVTGSPIKSACKVIAKRELRGRGYYSGIAALIGINQGKRYLDSAIMIRTADISLEGHFRLTAGASIVRDSIPQDEAEETRAKLGGVMDCFFGPERDHNYSTKSGLVLPPETICNVERSLALRNRKASAFWLGETHYQHKRLATSEPTIALIDMEDAFTEMIAYQLRMIGYTVSIIPWYEAKVLLPVLRVESRDDILFIGPGPGDPTNICQEKIVIARNLISQRLKEKRPLIGTCLGHQLICVELGIPIIQLSENRQGSQYKVIIQNNAYYVAFYNSFSATHNQSWWHSTIHGKPILLELLGGNEVVALAIEGLASIQFHNESFLTQDAFPIYKWLIDNALKEMPLQAADS